MLCMRLPASALQSLKDAGVIYHFCDDDEVSRRRLDIQLMVGVGVVPKTDHVTVSRSDASEI